MFEQAFKNIDDVLRKTPALFSKATSNPSLTTAAKDRKRGSWEKFLKFRAVEHRRFHKKIIGEGTFLGIRQAS